mmetsp:Transcript_44482/g.104413  ORF Transcript_44482/g.104413 Transcript_44482/m.104413 type:complete len:127 (-) Transcript_44482:132-512(-)
MALSGLVIYFGLDKWSLVMVSGTLLLLRQGVTIISFSATFMLINNSVTRSKRGRVNGLAMAIGSLFKAIGPAVGGSVFAWSLTTQVPLVDSTFVFVAVGVLELLVGVLSLLLPTSLNSAIAEEDVS